MSNASIAKEKKFGRMMMIIMGLFFATYLPTYVLKKVQQLNYNRIVDISYSNNFDNFMTISM